MRRLVDDGALIIAEGDFRSGSGRQLGGPRGRNVDRDPDLAAKALIKYNGP